MKRFIEGEDRSQSTLFPEHLEDYIAEDNPVRVIDVFVDELDLKAFGFEGIRPEVTGCPVNHPASFLKIYIYGYLNRAQSSRRLEREIQRSVELIWLTGHLTPDFKTIADIRKDNGKPIRRQIVEHPFGTIKASMRATHFLNKTISRLRTEMSLHVLAYNMKRAMQILGIAPLMAAMRA